MIVDVHSRRWGNANGGPDGMAIAASFLAWTLCEMGHDVRGFSAPSGSPPWEHPRMRWMRVGAEPEWTSDLIITTLQPQWRRFATAAFDADASDRLVYWHHYEQLPDAHGCAIAAPPAFPEARICLPPSSWAAEAGGEVTGDAILVPGAGALKGGFRAAETARLCPELRWFVLPCRHAPHDLDRWAGLGEVAPGPMAPRRFLARARAVLSPTRAEVHPLALVEAAVRGIPVVCSDLPGTRAALGESALYVDMDAPADVWAAALRQALAGGLPRLRLRPYAEVVADALHQLGALRRAA